MINSVNRRNKDWYRTKEYGWRAVIIFILFGIDTGEWE